MSWGRPYDAGVMSVEEMEELIREYPHATITPRRLRAVATAKATGCGYIRTLVEHDGAFTAVSYEPVLKRSQ